MKSSQIKLVDILWISLSALVLYTNASVNMIHAADAPW